MGLAAGCNGQPPVSPASLTICGPSRRPAPARHPGVEIAAIPAMQATLNQRYGVGLTGRLLLKKRQPPAHLGSIKARSGIPRGAGSCRAASAMAAGLLRRG